MKKSSLIILLLIAALMSACTGSNAASTGPESDSPTTVRLSMGYIPDVQFAPMYVGIDKGYFAEQGILLEIEHRQESEGAKLVATGELPFAIISGEQVLLGRSQELPLVYVFEWYQRFPVGVASKPEAGINSAADLAGRSVGVPVLEGASYIGLEALLFSAGLSDADIDLQTTGYAQVETLLTDRADAVVIYLANEPVQMLKQGIEPNLIVIDDFADLVSNGLVTNETLIEENPDLIQGMVTALAKAVAYTIANPDEAMEISKTYVEGLDSPDVEPIAREVLLRSISLWQDDAGQIGLTDSASWIAMQDVLLQMGLLSAPLDLDAAYTNRFLP